MPDLLDIIGQELAISQLQQAFTGPRRSHAYLFAGQEGIGKRTTAIEFAKLLLCENPQTLTNKGRLKSLPDDFPLRIPCNTCPSCRTIQAGTNPDLHIISKDLAQYLDDSAARSRVMQNLSIDVIRQFLIAPAYLASMSGRGKVFIILQAETMSQAAQNALLKTLEEPPNAVTIILTCSSPASLLATTRSRCQIIRFNPLPVNLVERLLIEQGVASEEAKFWANMTNGSIGRAMEFSRRGLYQFKRTLTETISTASVNDATNLAAMLMETADKKISVKKQSQGTTNAPREQSESLTKRENAQFILEILTSIFRDALTIALQAHRPLVHADQVDEIKKIAKKFTLEKLTSILTQLSRYEQILWQNVNAKLFWDNVAITCTTAEPLDI